MKAEEFLRTREARDFLKVSRATFDRLRSRAGFPKPVRLSQRCIRWRTAQLIAFTEAQQAPPGGK